MKPSAARVLVLDLKAAQEFCGGRLGPRPTNEGPAVGRGIDDAGPAHLVVRAVDPEALEDERALGARFRAAPAKQPCGGVVATVTGPADYRRQRVDLDRRA